MQAPGHYGAERKGGHKSSLPSKIAQDFAPHPTTPYHTTYLTYRVTQLTQPAIPVCVIGWLAGWLTGWPAGCRLTNRQRDSQILFCTVLQAPAIYMQSCIYPFTDTCVYTW